MKSANPIRWTFARGSWRCMIVLLVAWLFPVGPVSVLAQRAGENAEGVGVQDNGPRSDNGRRSGYVIEMPLPIDSAAAGNVIRLLQNIADAAPETQRLTVILRYSDEGAAAASSDSSFEDALKLARAITSPKLQRVKVVSFVQVPIEGHATLPILASESLIAGSRGSIGNASAGEPAGQMTDETVRLAYLSIAERRGLFPPAIVSALIDPGLELVLISKVDGGQVFASGQELESLRQSGQVLGEMAWSAPRFPLLLDARQLRTAQIASHVADSLEQAAESLDLASVEPLTEAIAGGRAVGRMLEITGSISSGRVRRWQSNLASTLDGGEVNTWLISLDSDGGSLDDSASLAASFAEPGTPLRTVAGVVRSEARADAVLIALACKPLYLMPDASLGGPGAETISTESLRRYDELIEEIARSTRRPAGLLRGLLDPSLVIYRYTHRKTGRIRYAAEADLVRDAEDPIAEKDKWIRGEAVPLQNGLSANEAIALGLAEAQVDTLQEAARRVGLDAIPPLVSDRGIVRLVERIGRSNTLAFFLLFVGFAALSAEANSPGLGIPGFISLICFALYFWMKFLAGTAEWLELVAFTLGIACIAIEIFVVPGFGVFGVGGMALTVLGIVLMSQTFVVPRNVYQVEVLSRGVWVALGGAAGLVGGFLAMRMMLPHVPMLRGLVMEPMDQAALDESEKLGDFAYLFGQTGIATTPLHPSGKARFGDEVIQVVSDGTAIAAGDHVRVCEVHATKVVVEPLEVR